MERASAEPFLVCSIYSPGFPAVLFGGPQMCEAGTDQTLPGSAVVISGGLCRTGAAADVRPSVLPTGLLEIGGAGYRFAEGVVARLVEPYDSVLIVDQKFSRCSDKWTGIAGRPEMELIEAEDAFVISALGTSLAGLNWCEGLWPSSSTYILTQQGTEGALANLLVNKATEGEALRSALEDYWKKWMMDSRSALAELGDYGIFVYIGGFDAQDIIIQRRETSAQPMREAACAAGRDLGLALYEGDTPSCHHDKGFWVEDDIWKPIPSEWSRLL